MCVRTCRTFRAENTLIGLSILSVHDDINDGVNARRRVDQHVAEHVNIGVRHILVLDLHDGDGQVADDESQKDGQHHFGDAPVTSGSTTGAAIFRAHGS